MPSLLVILCLLWAALLVHSSNASDVVATIADRRFDETEVHARFHYKDVFVLGSHYEGVAVHETNEDVHWTVSAPLVFALPNPGSLHRLMNAPEIDGKIVVFTRADDVLISEQLFFAQHANATAAIIVDFPNAFPKNAALHAATSSHPAVWDILTIPAVVISHHTFERMRAGLDLEKGDLRDSRDRLYKGQYAFKDSRYSAMLDDHDDPLDEL